MRFTIFKTPKEKMATVLTLLSLWAIFNPFSLELLTRILLIFVFMFIFEFLFWKIRGVELFRPTAGVVTALIIFLLADPKASYFLVLLALFVAIALKQLLRPGGNHIFNPAASGLILASFFGLPITWWGIKPDSLSLLATILLTGFVSLYVIRQYRIVFPFLVGAVILSATIIAVDTTLRQLLVGSFWFFTLVMLPEPMTAAHYPNTRIFYGVLVAALSIIFPFSGLRVDPLLLALLAGNLSVRLIEQRYQR